MINYVQKKIIREDRIKELLKKSFDMNQFTNNGPVKKDLELLLRSKLKISNNKSVVCLSNGTTACHALMFLYQKKLGKKLKWIVPSFTFPTPVIGGFSSKIVDINKETYTIDIEDAAVKNADGVIITNLFGTCNSIEEWEEYCKKSGKILIFDNASSPMTKLNGKNICDFGDASFGSLHHTKYMGFGEGGFAVVPNDDYEALNSIANFGFTSQRIHSSLSSNYKMSEVSAAYCYAQIEAYDINKHVDIQQTLLTSFQDANIEIFNISNKKANYVLGNLPILFKNSVDISSFRNLGVEANKYYKPLASFRNSKSLFSRIINLPLNESMTNYEIEMLRKVAVEVKKENER
jgi:dTDP-4-amino-4,6-dideoxygalactose transaminase